MYAKKLSSLGYAVLLVCSCSILGLAQAAGHDHQHGATVASGPKFLGMGDGLTTCAVTGETLANKNISGDFYGRKVYFCCEGCLAKAQQNPEIYVRQSADAKPAAASVDAKPHGEHQQSERKFLGVGDGITTCPVTGDPVNKDSKGEVNGRVFYVCCSACIDQIKKDPDLYLKPEKKDGGSEATFLGKGDGITTCPVTGEPISKDVKVEINGKTVYACCAGCIDQIKKNPDLYLKKN
jgi:YHS domain-containing protein